MLDDLSKNPNRDERRAPESQPAGPMADREVPLPAASPAFDTMHRWLDGEATEQEARRSEGGRYVDLWQRVGEEATERRQLAAPAGLADRIMLALPTETPRAAWRFRFGWPQPAVARSRAAHSSRPTTSSSVVSPRSRAYHRRASR